MYVMYHTIMYSIFSKFVKINYPDISRSISRFQDKNNLFACLSIGWWCQNEFWTIQHFCFPLLWEIVNILWRDFNKENVSHCQYFAAVIKSVIHITWYQKVGGLNINYMWTDNFWRKTIFNERQPFIERTFNGFQHWMEVDISSIKTKLWWTMTDLNRLFAISYKINSRFYWSKEFIFKVWSKPGQ